MTSNRRTRKLDNKKHPAITNESSNEDSSDSSSVTRCVCGEGHNVGLMVQCDMCEVWQHCRCIGLKEAKIPDHYYCEQCQPKNHQFIITTNGRSKRLYNATQSYMNHSRESISFNNHPVSESNSDTPTDNDSMKRPNKRRKKGDSGNNQGENIIHESVEISSRSVDISLEVESVGIPNYKESPTILLEKISKCPSEQTNDEIEDDLIIEERITRSRRTTKAADITIRENSQDFEEATSSPSRKKKNNYKRLSSINDKKSLKHKQSASQSIMEDSSPTTAISPYWNYDDGLPTRDNSPPAKIKYPTPKMSFSDMNKRAKQIMDCIHRLENSDIISRKKTMIRLEDIQSSSSSSVCTTPVIRTRSMSASSVSSESSASTIPLLDELSLLKDYPPYYHDHTSHHIIHQHPYPLYTN